MFTDTLIDAFVMPTKDDDVLLHRELVAQRLVEQLAVGAHVDDLVVVALAFQVVSTGSIIITMPAPAANE